MSPWKLLGTPPIHPVPFLAAKTLLGPPCLYLAYGLFTLGRGTRPWTGLAVAGASLGVAGLAAVLLAIRQLGESTRVGLPDEATEFKTHGLYRFSRNPIYTGLFVASVGSCLLVPHWLNIGSSIATVLLHHRIVLAEERFLDGRFGKRWREYRARVSRYV